MQIAIVEDDVVYRSGLVQILTAAGCDVMLSTGHADALLDYLQAQPARVVDVVLLDIRLSRQDPQAGLHLAGAMRLRHPDVGVLLLSSHVNRHYVETFFAGGTSGRGYVLKENFHDVREISAALDRIASGKTYSDPEILDLLVSGPRPDGLQHILTPREQDMLRLIADGLTNAAVAAQLGLSAKSVESMVTSIFRKLDLPYGENRNPRVLAALRWVTETGPGRDLRDRGYGD